MNINRLFNQFISRNFKGLSTATLCQFIKLYSGLSFVNNTYINNLVYVDIYHVFTGCQTEEEQHSYDAVKAMVASCDWL